MSKGRNKPEGKTDSSYRRQAPQRLGNLTRAIVYSNMSLPLLPALSSWNAQVSSVSNINTIWSRKHWPFVNPLIPTFSQSPRLNLTLIKSPKSTTPTSPTTPRASPNSSNFAISFCWPLTFTTPPHRPAHFNVRNQSHPAHQI